MTTAALAISMLLGATRVVAPTFTPASGTTFTSSPQSITVRSATAGASVYCTTGSGAIRTSSNRLAGTTISIAATATLRCQAFRGTRPSSRVSTASYTINLAPPAAPPEAVVVNSAHVDAAAIPQGYLDEIRKLDILWQHKSTGDVMTFGLAQMATDTPYRYGLTQVGWHHGGNYLGTGWVEITPPATWFDTNTYGGTIGALASSENGHNTDPESKTTAFNQTMRGLPINYTSPYDGFVIANDSGVSGEYGLHVSIAMMKFCFEEIWRGTAQSTWDAYRITYEGLMASYPGVSFVWFTMPLAYVQGQTPSPEAAIARDFNELVRAYVNTNGGFLLDVADIEQTCADGTRPVSGTIPLMCSTWASSPTDPHPNTAGAMRLAAAWWWMMARVVGWDGANAPGGGGTVYRVGPGQAYTSLGAVPWYALAAGDTVYVHYRSTPYYEKVLISTSGTPTQWIRVIGVPDPTTGALPVVSGQNAVTSTNCHWRWQDPSIVQLNTGPISIAPDNGSGYAPAYIEIAYLNIRDAVPGSTFTAENGATTTYGAFTPCIYMRNPRHILVRDSIIASCGQGIYNWNPDGGALDLNQFWSAASQDITVRRNYFSGHGNAGGWTEHQSYLEADGVVYEGNRYGTMRSGAYGNQLKDRSAGTVIRYNYFEQTPADGYFIDLVEPESPCASLCGSYATTRTDAIGRQGVPNPKYLQTWVYGNTFRRTTSNGGTFVHWNEDHQVGGKGRAAEAGSKMFFFHNTAIDGSAQGLPITQQYGAATCTSNLPGITRFANNVFYSAAGGTWYFGDPCQTSRLEFMREWFTPSYSVRALTTSGTSNIVTSGNAGVGFTSYSGGDFRPTADSSLLGAGVALDAEIVGTTNSTGVTHVPRYQYGYPHASPTPIIKRRPHYGAGSDLGAFER